MLRVPSGNQVSSIRLLFFRLDLTAQRVCDGSLGSNSLAACLSNLHLPFSASTMDGLTRETIARNNDLSPQVYEELSGPMGGIPLALYNFTFSDLGSPVASFHKA